MADINASSFLTGLTEIMSIKVKNCRYKNFTPDNSVQFFTFAAS